MVHWFTTSRSKGDDSPTSCLATTLDPWGLCAERNVPPCYLVTPGLHDTYSSNNAATHPIVNHQSAVGRSNLPAGRKHCWPPTQHSFSIRRGGGRRWRRHGWYYDYSMQGSSYVTSTIFSNVYRAVLIIIRLLNHQMNLSRCFRPMRYVYMLFNVLHRSGVANKCSLAVASPVNVCLLACSGRDVSWWLLGC